MRILLFRVLKLLLVLVLLPLVLVLGAALVAALRRLAMLLLARRGLGRA